MQDELMVHEQDGLLDIVLNRPDRGNELTASMIDSLQAVLTTLGAHVRLVRLGGSGADFCIGRESPMPARGAQVAAETLRKIVARPALDLYDAIKAAPVPVLSVVRGRATGIGCALAGVCDLAIASEDALFQIPELERDIPPTLVMAALVDRVPLKTLSYLVLSRERIDARQALAAGLVSAVVPVGEIDAESERATRALLHGSASSLRAVKQFLRWAPQAPAGGASALAEHMLATSISARYSAPSSVREP
jgi:enoyl-CoA hydratase